ncbi:MAG: hypothetical protein JSU90_08000 [Nitrospiraceae bacterium]|nr:MAG: hypothetical protein JSU90_08000 [Nitrospiraceae bacterium]
MKKSERSNRTTKTRNVWGFLFVLLVIFAVTAGASYFYLRERFAVESSFIDDIEARRDQSRRDSGEKTSGRLYGNGGDEPEGDAGMVSRREALLVAAEDIIRKYLEPYNARLLDLYMDREGVMYVDFGDEIRRGLSLDAGQELKLIAGLYRNIQSTIPEFRALKILIDGQEAESLAGHVDIRRPIGEDIAAYI